MNSIYDLCEEGLNINECDKLVFAGVTIEKIKNNQNINANIKKLFKKARNKYLKNENVFSKKTVYEMYEVGISKNLIDKFIKKRITMDEFINLTVDELKEKFKLTNSTIYKAKDALFKLGYVDRFACPRNIISGDILKNRKNLDFYENQEKQYRELLELGLSKTVYNILISKNIEFERIIYLTGEEIKNEINVSDYVANSIVEVCYKYKKKNDLSINRIEDELREYIKTNSLRKMLPYEKILSYWNFKEFNENLDELLEKLIQSKIIIQNKNLYRYKYSKIRDIIYSIKDTKKKNILLERLSGKTLEEIGNEFKITRERVRQIIKKVLSSQKVYEEKYYNVFVKYNLTKEDFCMIFNEDSMTYYYLDSLYKKGQLDIFEFIKDFERIINPELKEKLFDKYNKLDFNGSIVTIDSTNIIKEYLKTLEEQTKVTKILKDLNIVLIKNNVNPIDIRSLNARLDRGLSYNVIATSQNRYRYYNYKELSTEKISKCLNIFKRYDLGYYSTFRIFKDNLSFFEEINIKDEYELHSLLRIINDGTFIVERMPNFKNISISKHQFFTRLIMEKSPVNINEFLKFIFKNYGHKTNSTKSYLLDNFKDYINFNIVDINIKKLNSNQINLLKSKITEDIYQISKFKELMNKYLNGEYESYLNNYNLRKIGYKINMTYIIKSKIYSLESYLKENILNQDFYEKEKKYNTSTYDLVLRSLEKKNDIIRIDNNKYITIKKLNELGITKIVLNEYKKFLNEKINLGQYFTIYYLQKECEFDKIDKYGFDDIFYESILNSDDNYSYVKFNNNLVFKKKNKNEKNRITQSEFLSELVKETGSIDIYDFNKILKNKFDIIISKEDLQQLVWESGLYYDKFLEKIFYNKEEYYREVYE